VSGLAGISTRAIDGRRAAAARDRMTTVMVRPSDVTGRLDLESPALWLGWHGPARGRRGAQTAASGESTIVFVGELYGAPTRAPAAAVNGAAPQQASNAHDVLHGYLRQGRAFFAQLEGRFVAALWDADRRQCVVVSDKFGTKPLYFSHDGQSFAFATQIKGLLALPWASTTLNRRGLAQFFAFGHLWNQDTLFDSVRCLPSATAAVFDPSSGRLSLERYWRPVVGARQSAAASLETLDAQFKIAVDERTVDTPQLGMSLSGGLDARTILGVMDHPRTPTTCVSLGMQGSLDQRSAQKLAELVDCPYHTLVLDRSFLADFERHLTRMVELTDGHYLSQCIVMPTLPLYERLGIDVLLRGHAGELLHMHKAYNFSMDEQAAALPDDGALQQWLFARLQSHLTDGVDQPVICGVSHEEFQTLARDTLAEALAEVDVGDHPVDRVSQLFLDQRTRRETAMSLVKFDSVVETRLPYLDGRVVDAVFQTPPELRRGESIQTHILRRRRPEFLRPANSNTGAPVGAGALRQAFCYYRMRILGKLGVAGYQPYERLGLWLRQDLRPVVERILLSPACLDRGLLQPDAVRHVVRRHVAGERNHTFLLMAMMILETGFRRLYDPSPAADAQGSKQRLALSR